MEAKNTGGFEGVGEIGKWLKKRKKTGLLMGTEVANARKTSFRI
jgi:hypothetical protein